MLEIYELKRNFIIHRFWLIFYRLSITFDYKMVVF